MKTQGRKEVLEAVTIAALSALAGGLINFGVEELKKHVAKKQAVTAKVEEPKTTDAPESDNRE